MIISSMTFDMLLRRSNPRIWAAQMSHMQGAVLTWLIASYSTVFVLQYNGAMYSWR